VAIIEHFCLRYPDKAFFIKDDLKNLGTAGNFSRIMEFSNAGYLMFCDQDDIWLPDKIDITLNLVKTMEGKYGPDTPVLAFTDLRVVDKDLNTIAESFWKYLKLKPKISKHFNKLLLQNVVTGCTVMINFSLKEILGAIPADAVMHDWWLALAASAFGKIGYLNSRPVLYRQHEKNVIGTKIIQRKIKKNFFGKVFEHIIHFDEKKLKFRTEWSKIGTKEQAESFLNKFREQLKPDKIRLLQEFSHLEKNNFIVKRLKLLRYGLLGNTLLTNIIIFLYI
jgi:glycosyltransferase involved in cell wall biosynthesis